MMNYQDVREQFLMELLKLDMPRIEILQIATVFQDISTMTEMLNFLSENPKATNQQIWNEAGRIVKKYPEIQNTQ